MTERQVRAPPDWWLSNRQSGTRLPRPVSTQTLRPAVGSPEPLVLRQGGSYEQARSAVFGSLTSLPTGVVRATGQEFLRQVPSLESGSRERLQGGLPVSTGQGGRERDGELGWGQNRRCRRRVRSEALAQT